MYWSFRPFCFDRFVIFNKLFIVLIFYLSRIKNNIHRCVDAHGRLHNTEVWWHFELVHQYPLCQLATLYLQHREHTFIRNSLWYDCCWKVDWCTEINVWSKSNTTASAPSLGEYRTHSASNLYGNRTQVLWNYSFKSFSWDIFHKSLPFFDAKNFKPIE